MKVYLSGPMSGYPNNNAGVFRTAAAALKSMGHEVTSPVELDEGNGVDLSREATDLEYESLLERDLAIIPGHDGMVLLPGWEKSGGVGREGRVALEHGLKLYTWRPETPRGLYVLDAGRFMHASTTRRAVSA